MQENIFLKFCQYVDSHIFSRDNVGETVAFVVDQAFIDDFCKQCSVTEKELQLQVKDNLYKPTSAGHLHVKGILAIQLFAASKREDANYRDRLSQILNWNIDCLQNWMKEYQDSYWKFLYQWCKNNGFDIAQRTPYEGTGRYVQYPIQQAERVFTVKDLKSIAYHFVDNNIQPGEDLSEDEFWRILSKRKLHSYVHTNHGKKLVENNDYLKGAYRQVYDYYLRWNGAYNDLSDNSRVTKNKEFYLYLSEKGYVDIRDKNMKRQYREELNVLTEKSLANYYSFKRRGLIIFRKNDDYPNYWEETRFLEDKEDGIAMVFSNSIDLLYNQHCDITKLKPFEIRRHVKLYRISYDDSLRQYYTEKRFFSLEGGLKVGRMTYLIGGEPFLVMDKNVPFWIDGKFCTSKPENGYLLLDYLLAGHHTIKFQGYRKIEFDIVSSESHLGSWNDSYCQWSISKKHNEWAPVKSPENGIVGIDFPPIEVEAEQNDGLRIATKWALFHIIRKRTDDTDNIALRLLYNTHK